MITAVNGIAISIIAGMLAGIGTGFAGLSAAVFTAPMLMVFVGVDSYSADIALASDVLASAASAVTYKMNGHIDLKRGRILIANRIEPLLLKRLTGGLMAVSVIIMQ